MSTPHTSGHPKHYQNFHRAPVDLTQDALREAMTRAWDHWEDEGRTLQNPEAWLYTLTRNAALTWHRKEKTRAKLMPEVYSRQKRPNEPLDEVVHRKLLTEHALRAIDAMPPRVREPFRSYVFDEQSYEEIAHRHGLTVSAARLRVQMGFRYLRQLYEGERLVHWDGDEDLADRLTAHLSTIAYAMNDTEVVQVRLPGGGVLEYHSVFEQTVKRRQQRIGTLCNYVANHERGWRKRFCGVWWYACGIRSWRRRDRGRVARCASRRGARRATERCQLARSLSVAGRAVDRYR